MSKNEKKVQELTNITKRTGRRKKVHQEMSYNGLINHRGGGRAINTGRADE